MLGRLGDWGHRAATRLVYFGCAGPGRAVCWGDSLSLGTVSGPGQPGHSRERAGPGRASDRAEMSCFGRAVGLGAIWTTTR